MIFNKRSEEFITAFIRRPRSAAILDTTVDFDYAMQAADFIIRELELPEHSVSVLEPEGSSIGIDQIRELKRHISLFSDKTTKTLSRIVIISNAQSLTEDAQNTLLKLLEELPSKTSIVLVGDGSKLLPTVQSRCFNIPLLPLSESQIKNFSKTQKLPTPDYEKAYLFSEGHPDIFTKFCHNEYDAWVQMAKQLLSLDYTQRINLVMTISKDRESCLHLLRALKVLSKTAMRASVGYQKKSAWKKRLEKILHTESNLQKNASSRLHMLDLSISL